MVAGPAENFARAAIVTFLIDTNICSDYLRNRGGVPQRFQQHSGELAISVITLGELQTWVHRRHSAKWLAEGLGQMLMVLDVLPVDQAVANHFGLIRADLFDRGRPTPDLDLLIAATALVHGLTIVTHNIQDFECVSSLSIIDWQ